MAANWTTTEEIAKLPPRKADANKGNFGRVLVIAGSRGMSGAAVLCGSAALRGGAGLVSVATPSAVLPIVAAGNPCYMTIPLPEDSTGIVSEAAIGILRESQRQSAALAIGPGLGASDTILLILRALLFEATVPVVIDADGLNALAKNPAELRSAHSRVIVTPHPGEFARLTKLTVAEVQSSRERLAAQFALEHGVVVVLKGHGTVVTDGKQLAVNQTGNPGMATGGSGDVLTGLIAALLGQGLEPFAAARLGVHIHGLAGDLVRDTLGEVGIIASDLLGHLPSALRTFSESSRRG